MTHPMDHDVARASWDTATPWDKAVRLSRARAAIDYPNRTTVTVIDGRPHLVDADDDTRKAPL